MIILLISCIYLFLIDFFPPLWLSSSYHHFGFSSPYLRLKRSLFPVPLRHGPGAFYRVIQSRMRRVRDWSGTDQLDYITCLRLEGVLNYLEQLEKLEVTEEKNTGWFHVVSSLCWSNSGCRNRIKYRQNLRAHPIPGS